ncbi:uncharacterized protein LOC144436711 isoform X2 [Glandiceps talaboti]
MMMLHVSSYAVLCLLCICVSGVKGYCQPSSSDPFAHEECHSHGRCRPDGSCDCYYAYSGIRCEICDKPDYCPDTTTAPPIVTCNEPKACSSHGDCYDRIFGISCYCDSGYYGDRCEFSEQEDYDVAKKKSDNVKYIALIVIYSIVGIVVFVTVIIVTRMVRSTWDFKCNRLIEPDHTWTMTRQTWRDTHEGGFSPPTIENSFRQFPAEDGQSGRSSSNNPEGQVETNDNRGFLTVHQVQTSQLDESHRHSLPPPAMFDSNDEPPSYTEVTEVQGPSVPQNVQGQPRHVSPISIGESGTVGDQIEATPRADSPPPTYETAIHLI